MARTLQSQLILSLIDRVTAPARGIQGTMDRLNARIQRNNQALSSARMGMVDAIGAYYTLRTAIAAPIEAAARFETAMEDIAQKADLPVNQLEALGDRIKAVARDTNQANMDIAGAVDALAGRGASLDVAMAAAAPIGKAATAYRAATDDLAAASWAAVDNLKVPAEQVGKTLDIMAQAGKSGAFELRDMATYFPALGAAYQGLGQEGTDAVADLAAALQVVRKGTGDASSAATNLQNVLQKVYAPATVNKFAAAGVDVFSEMEAAAQRGLTPIEAIAELTDRTLNGDLSRMGTLFEDAQVQAGLRSIIQNLDEYRRIRAEAMGADGVVDKDFARRIKTTAGLIKRWTAMADNLQETLGAALVPVLHRVLDVIGPLIELITALIEAHPELVANTMMAVGSLIALRGAIAAIRFAGLLGKSGALSLLAGGMNTVGRAGFAMRGAVSESIRLQTALAAMDGSKIGLFGKMSAGLRGLAGVTGLTAVSQGVAAVGATIAGISAPAWLAIAVAVGAVGAAWKYWDRIGAIVGGVADAIGQSLKPVVEDLRAWIEPAAPIIDRFGEALAFVDEKIKAAAEWARTLTAGLFTREILTEGEQAELRGRASKMTTDLIAYFAALPGKLLTIGGEMIQKLWDGMEAKFAGLLERVTSMADQIGAKWRGILSGGRSDQPDLGVYDPATGYGQAKAVGGHMRARVPALVGERGPELVYPSRSGWVAHARQAQRLSEMARRPRAMPVPAQSRASHGGRPVNVTFGNIVIQGGANASARDISREIGRTVQAELRGAFTDPY